MSAAPVPSPPLAKLRDCVLAEILPRLALAAPAAELLANAPDAPVALDKLDAAGLHTEAARLLAYALPAREAVWWACMCARHTQHAESDAGSRAALEAAEQWVFRGEDDARRAAFAGAEAASFNTPEAWAGVGAFWSGDSMAPLGQPKVPPGPYLAATAIAGAVVLAAVRDPPQRRPARLVQFIVSGRAIADGGTGRLPPEAAI